MEKKLKNNRYYTVKYTDKPRRVWAKQTHEQDAYLQKKN